MTQPGASKLLSDLEDSLGVQLFTRHARGIEPTWYGEIMTRRARSALAEMDRAQLEIDALRSGLAGQTTIGAVLSAGTSLVPLAVASLKQRHPKILVRVEIDSSDALIGRLLNGEFDMVLARVPDSHVTSEVNFVSVGGEMHKVIAGAAHPLLGKRRLELSDLVDEPWILPPSGSILRNRIDSIFVHRGLGLPRNLVETNSLPLMISLMQSTNMISASGQETIAPDCKAGLLAVLPLKLGVHMEPFGIVTRRNHHISPSGEAMLGALRDAAARTFAKPMAAVSSGRQPPPSKRRKTASTTKGAVRRP